MYQLVQAQFNNFCQHINIFEIVPNIFNMHFIRTIKSEQELNLNGEMWYISDIIQAVKSDIENVINEKSYRVHI